MPRYRKPYTLYQYTLSDGITRVWYYRVYDHRNKRIARSTGETDKIRAMRYCDKLLREGNLIPQHYPTLSQWAEERRWWIWGECLYCKGRLRRSDPERPAISRRYVDDALRTLKQKILPSHGNKRLDEITVQDCEQLLFSWADGGYSYKSANNWASIYRVMLNEAVRIGLLEKNPWNKVRPLTPSLKRRGILTTDEARKLLNPKTVDAIWDGHHLYYTINLTAAFTALRQGEILALQRKDVFEDHLHVAHSWSIKYGLQPTKTKVVADIPIPEFLYREIEKYLDWSGFVFSFDKGETPATGNRITGWLYRALASIGIDEDERKRRNITFHSWRHWLNTSLRSRGIADVKIQAITQHRTKEMTEHYTKFRLEDFRDVHWYQQQ